jgi:chromosome segregation ATPase
MNYGECARRLSLPPQHSQFGPVNIISTKLNEVHQASAVNLSRLQAVQEALQISEEDVRDREEKLLIAQRRLHEAEENFQAAEKFVEQARSAQVAAEAQSNSLEEELHHVEKKLKSAEQIVSKTEKQLKFADEALQATEKQLRANESMLQERSRSLEELTQHHTAALQALSESKRNNGDHLHQIVVLTDQLQAESQQRAKVEAELARVMEDLYSVTNANSSREDQVAHFMEQNDSLNEKVQQLLGEIQEREDRYTAMQQHVHQFEEALENERLLHMQAQAKCNEMEVERDFARHIRQEVDEYQRLLEAERTACRDAQQQVAELRIAKEQAEHVRLEVSNELLALQERAHRIVQDSDTKLESEMKSAVKKREVLETALNQAKELRESLFNQMSLSREEFESQIAVLKSDLETQKLALDVVTQEKMSLEFEKTDLLKRCTELMQIVEQRDVEIVEQQTLADELQSTVLQLHSQVQNLEQLEFELFPLKHIVNELAGDLNRAVTECLTLREERSMLQDRFSQCQSEISDVQDQVRNKVQQIEGLNELMSQEREVASITREQLAQAQRQVAETNGTLENMQADLEKIRQENEDLRYKTQSEHNNITSTISQPLSALAVLQQKYEKLQQERDKLVNKAERSDRMERNFEMVQRINSELTANLAKLQKETNQLREAVHNHAVMKEEMIRHRRENESWKNKMEEIERMEGERREEWQLHIIQLQRTIHTLEAEVAQNSRELETALAKASSRCV